MTDVRLMKHAEHEDVLEMLTYYDPAKLPESPPPVDAWRDRVIHSYLRLLSEHHGGVGVFGSQEMVQFVGGVKQFEAVLRAEAQREQVEEWKRLGSTVAERGDWGSVAGERDWWRANAIAWHDKVSEAWEQRDFAVRLSEIEQREQAALVHALETVVVQLDRVPASVGPALGVARRAIAAHRDSLGVGVEAAEEATG